MDTVGYLPNAYSPKFLNKDPNYLCIHPSFGWQRADNFVPLGVDHCLSEAVNVGISLVPPLGSRGRSVTGVDPKDWGETSYSMLRGEPSLFVPLETNKSICSSHFLWQPFDGQRATSLDEAELMWRQQGEGREQSVLTFLCFWSYCAWHPPFFLWTSSYAKWCIYLLLKPLCGEPFLQKTSWQHPTSSRRCVYLFSLLTYISSRKILAILIKILDWQSTGLNAHPGPDAFMGCVVLDKLFNITSFFLALFNGHNNTSPTCLNKVSVRIK